MTVIHLRGGALPLMRKVEVSERVRHLIPWIVSQYTNY